LFINQSITILSCAKELTRELANFVCRTNADTQAFVTVE